MKLIYLAILVHALAFGQQDKPHAVATPAIQQMLVEDYKIQDPAQALQAYKKLVDSATAAKDVYGEGIGEFWCGCKYRDLAKWRDALDCFRLAIEKLAPLNADFERSQAIYQQGYCQEKLKDVASAYDSYRKALDLAVEGKNQVGQMMIMNALGLLCDNVGKREEARQYDERAVRIAVDLKTWSEAGILQNNLAAVYQNIGREQDALDSYNQAITSFVNAKNSEPMIAQTKANMAMVYKGLGDEGKALELLNEALPVQHASGNVSGESVTLNNIGSVYNDLGDQDQAFSYYNRALALDKDNEYERATTLNNIGEAYASMGQVQKALDCYRQSLDLHQSNHRDADVASVLNNIGTLYADLGDLPTALKYLNEAMPVRIRANDKAGEATTLNTLGGVYQLQDKVPEAMAKFTQALVLWREIGNKSGEAATLNNIGWCCSKQSQPQEALGNYRQALDLKTTLGDKTGEATALLNIGSTLEEQDNVREALPYFARALTLKRQAQDKAGEAFVLKWLQQSFSDLELPDIAIAFGKESVDDYQGLRSNMQSLPFSLRKTYDRQIEPEYRELAGLLLKRGRFEEAEQVMGLLREAEAFDFVKAEATRGAAFQDKIEKLGKEQGWLDDWNKLQDQSLVIDKEYEDLAKKQAKLAESGQKLSPDEEQLLRRRDEDEKRLNTASAAYITAVQTDVQSMGNGLAAAAKEKIQAASNVRSRLQHLRSEGVAAYAVYAVAAADELHFIVVSPDGPPRPVSVPLPADKLNMLVAQFREVLKSPSQDPRPAGKALYDQAFAKVVGLLRAAKAEHVMWCLDGTLRYVPLAALWDGSHYLLETEQISMFDPLHMDVVVSSNHPAEHMAAFASSEGYKDRFQPLKGAAKELSFVVNSPGQQLAGVIPGHGWKDSEFTGEALRQAIENDDNTILHIATHFDLGTNFATSILLLGGGQNRELPLQTFLGWGDSQFGHVDLVCLSACDTAERVLEPASAGAEVTSFVDLTLKEGAQSVIASLWPVNDEATPMLMHSFYQNWLAHPEKGKGEALRQAQLGLLNGANGSGGATQRSPEGVGQATFTPDPKKPFSHPYYWAPFLLFGNWR